jgi:hypothetical protein
MSNRAEPVHMPPPGVDPPDRHSYEGVSADTTSAANPGGGDGCES